MSSIKDAINLSNLVLEAGELVDKTLEGPISNRDLRNLVKWYQDITNLLTTRMLIQEQKLCISNEVNKSLAKMV